jgi:hypothetical protein
MIKLLRLLADHSDLAAVAVLVVLLGSPTRPWLGCAVDTIAQFSDQRGISLVVYEEQPNLLFLHE